MVATHPRDKTAYAARERIYSGDSARADWLSEFRGASNTALTEPFDSFADPEPLQRAKYCARYGWQKYETNQISSALWRVLKKPVGETMIHQWLKTEFACEEIEMNTGEEKETRVQIVHWRLREKNSGWKKRNA
jgi:hypothetical protein